MLHMGFCKVKQTLIFHNSVQMAAILSKLIRQEIWHGYNPDTFKSYNFGFRLLRFLCSFADLERENISLKNIDSGFFRKLGRI